MGLTMSHNHQMVVGEEEEEELPYHTLPRYLLALRIRYDITVINIFECIYSIQYRGSLCFCLCLFLFTPSLLLLIIIILLLLLLLLLLLTHTPSLHHQLLRLRYDIIFRNVRVYAYGNVSVYVYVYV